MKNKKYPKYGNKASHAAAKEIQKANSTPAAKREIKRLKKEVGKISDAQVDIIDLGL